jgi:predicted nucleotidyltransferase
MSMAKIMYTNCMTASALQLPITMDKLVDTLRKYGVTEASVFGSYARGEATEASDLDLLVSYKPGTSLFDTIDLQDELEKITKKKIDIASKLHPRFEPYITPDLVKIL